MALTQYTADTDIIETLGTKPEDRPTLTDDTFKAKFDENAANIKAFLNAMIAELASTANGKGASQIGIEDSGGKFTATTVEAALAEYATLISNEAVEREDLINLLAKKSYIWGVTPSDTVIASLSNVTAGVSYSQLVKQFYVKHGGKYRVKGTISAAGTVVLSTTTNADTDESNPANSYLSAVFSAASAGAFTLDMTIAVPPSSIIRIWYDPAASGNTLTNLTVCGTLSAVSNADVMEVISV